MQRECRVGLGRERSLKAESVSLGFCLNAIVSPTCLEEETVLDCRSHCAPARPW